MLLRSKKQQTVVLSPVPKALVKASMHRKTVHACYMLTQKRKDKTRQDDYAVRRFREATEKIAASGFALQQQARAPCHMLAHEDAAG